MPSKQYHITDRIYFCHESSIYQLPSIMDPVSRIYCPEESRQCNYLSVSSASHRQIYILLLLLSAVATSSAQQQQCCGDVGQNDEYCQNIYARDCSNCYRRININICCSLLVLNQTSSTLWHQWHDFTLRDTTTIQETPEKCDENDKDHSAHVFMFIQASWIIWMKAQQIFWSS